MKVVAAVILRARSSDRHNAADGIPPSVSPPSCWRNNTGLTETEVVVLLLNGLECNKSKEVALASPWALVIAVVGLVIVPPKAAGAARAAFEGGVVIVSAPP